MANPADIALEKAARGEPLDDDDAYALLQLPPHDLASLCEIAGAMRDAFHGRTLTYSPKVFLPVTNLCRDRCTYCTFRRDPGDPGEWTMTPQEIADWSQRGRALGCIEALMCLGDKPEIAFRGFKSFLADHGARTTAEYVAIACRISLAAGLLPHTNAGLLSKSEMEMLRPLNVSMGLMLENISPRLRWRGMPHFHAPDKDPAPRIRMIAEAGQLRIAFTSGILVGIGETEAERVASLLALRRVHEQYGHIQEIIVQNFRAKEATKMEGAPEISDEEMVRTVAIARLVLGRQMNLQAPPNLSPGNLHHLIRAGINDWGGISPLTIDYVNPEAAWPAVARLAAVCRDEGYALAARLPVYREYIDDRFIDPALVPFIDAFRNRATQDQGACHEL
ncbi:MAG TPA: 7,8-didemethyl-8-hydroxy-5-deazariboflavin synthase CofG [Candidatus Limnocylindrales bacterium]|nr:7,8-didemethyl-8-hydroxy-5-deazariboflavin synthase CofG [Candidatus Limnocylindrales bacterium]